MRIRTPSKQPGKQDELKTPPLDVFKNPFQKYRPASLGCWWDDVGSAMVRVETTRKLERCWMKMCF